MKSEQVGSHNIKIEQNMQKVNEESIKSTKNHIQHDHDELDSDCEGCRQEKKQNQKLVDFYNRLDKMNHKVNQIKSTKQNIKIKEQIRSSQNLNDENNYVTFEEIEDKLLALNEKLNVAELPSVGKIKEINQKDMGFELACALIQRQVKFKNQNQRLKAQIQALLSQKQAKNNHFQEGQSKLFVENQSAISKKQHDSYMKDSLDELSKPLTYQINQQSKKQKQKNDISYWNMSESFTSKSLLNEQQSTFFQTKKRQIIPNEADNKHRLIRSSIVDHQKPQDYGLNLWLYQFKPQEYQYSNYLNQNKSLLNTERKNNRYGHNKKNSININRTMIIEKNILNGNKNEDYKGKRLNK